MDNAQKPSLQGSDIKKLQQTPQKRFQYSWFFRANKKVFQQEISAMTALISLISKVSILRDEKYDGICLSLLQLASLVRFIPFFREKI